MSVKSVMGQTGLQNRWWVVVVKQNCGLTPLKKLVSKIQFELNLYKCTNDVGKGELKK